MSGAGSVSDVQAVIAGYAPCSLSAPAAAFVRGVVAQAAPAMPARAKALLFAAGKLAAFGERIGLELDAGVLLCEPVIERLIVAFVRKLATAAGFP